MLKLYRQLRFGSETAALEMLAGWMQLNTNVGSKIALEFHRDNRQSFEELAICIGRQLPEHAIALERQFLTTFQGDCVLPAAYTLTFSHQYHQGTMNQWIAFLDEMLADKSVGNERINWLLARAQADDVRLAPGRQEPTSASGWLDEASLIAETPEAKLRIAQERIARLATLRMWEAANAEWTAAQRPQRGKPSWKTLSGR